MSYNDPDNYDLIVVAVVIAISLIMLVTTLMQP